MAKILPLLLAASALPALALAQEDETQRALRELRERVDELEEQQARTYERVGGRAVAQAYTADSLDFGGHVTSLFTSMRGEAGTETGHVVSLLELFLHAKLDESWSLFATPGFYVFHGPLLDDPTTPSVAGDPAFLPQSNGEASTILSRLYGQWRDGDAIRVQGGIVGSPHGTTNREYFIPARTIGQGSLHTRVFQENQLYPQQLDGICVSGKLPLGSGVGRLEYDVYFGTEGNSPDDPIGGGRLAYVFGDIGLTVAANYGRGTREQLAPADALANVGILQSPFPASFNGGRDYEFVGVDIDWRLGDFICKTEAYVSAEDGYADQRALSTEWTWFAAPEIGLSYRFDYYDPGADQRIVSVAPFATVSLPLGHATEHAIGVCFDPQPSVRLRLDLHHLLLPDTDDTIDFLNLSWSVSF